MDESVVRCNSLLQKKVQNISFRLVYLIKHNSLVLLCYLLIKISNERKCYNEVLIYLVFYSICITTKMRDTI